MSKAPYEVLLDPRAERDLERIDKRDSKRINKKIRSLQDNPRPRKTTKLGDSEYRVRVGHWRILYFVDDEFRKIVISRVKRRNERTYK